MTVDPALKPGLGPLLRSLDQRLAILERRADPALTHLLRLPVRVSAGSVSVTVTGTFVGNTAISFPADRFTVAPLVFATLQTAPANSGKFVARVLNSATTGADVYVYTGDLSTPAGSPSVTVAWLAVQMTSSTAAG